jgi:antitoxin HicB
MVIKKTVKKESRVFQVIKGGVVLEFQSEPEGGYTVSVPSLPGCISYAETFEQALDMIKDAMDGWLVVARAEGVPIPEQFKHIKTVAL